MHLPSNLTIIEALDIKTIGDAFFEAASKRGRDHISPLHVAEGIPSSSQELTSCFQYIALKVAGRKDAFGIFAPALMDDLEKRRLVEHASDLASEHPARDIFVVSYKGVFDRLYTELPFYKVRFSSLSLKEAPYDDNLDGGRAEVNRILVMPAPGRRSIPRDITIGGEADRKVEFVTRDKFDQVLPSAKPAAFG